MGREWKVFGRLEKENGETSGDASWRRLRERRGGMGRGELGEAGGRAWGER